MTPHLCHILLTSRANRSFSAASRAAAGVDIVPGMRASALASLVLATCSLSTLHARAQAGAEPPAGATPPSTGALPPQPAAPPGQPPPVQPAPAPPPASAAPPYPGAPPPGYPPAGYAPGAVPPPGYTFEPQPGAYGQPPAYGYPPPGYYYPPPGYVWAPPTRQKPQYPEDAAGQTSPFLDMLVAGVAADKRYDHFFTVGVQGGAYLASRVRLVGRILMFTTEATDDLASSYYGDDVLPGEYSAISADSPAVIFGGAIGVAPVVRRNFVFAPGLAFHTTNVGAYGSMLTLAMPFEWVTDDGARFGFEVDIGRAFGGTITGRCNTPSSCQSDEKEFDRPSAPAFLAAFELGWGFNHPPAKMPAAPGSP